MEKLFSANGMIANFPWPDHSEVFYDEDGISIEIQDGMLIVRAESLDRLSEAKELAEIFLSAWSHRQGIRLSVVFNVEVLLAATKERGYHLNLSDSIALVDRVNVTTQCITGKAKIVTQEMIDTASFSNDRQIVKKASKYPALRDALQYYHEEVVDNDRPLYGLYKCLEAMCNHLSSKAKAGRKALASLVREPFEYVDNVMETTQVKRHHHTDAKRKLTDDECRDRTQKLIKAFADSLS